MNTNLKMAGCFIGGSHILHGQHPPRVDLSTNARTDNDKFKFLFVRQNYELVSISDSISKSIPPQVNRFSRSLISLASYDRDRPASAKTRWTVSEQDSVDL